MKIENKNGGPTGVELNAEKILTDEQLDETVDFVHLFDAETKLIDDIELDEATWARIMASLEGDDAESLGFDEEK